MKVTMLGRPSAGKTTFMAALREVLLLTRFHDYYIVPSATDFSERVRSVGQFEQLSFGYTDYQFPPSTQQTTIWNFELRHHEDSVCKLEWIDYRGGILDDIFSPEIQQDSRRETELKNLLKHVEDSDAVLLFADSIALTNYQDRASISTYSGARMLNQIMQLYATVQSKRNLIVLLILAKADSDAISPVYKDHNFELLIKTGQVAFRDTILLCRQNAPRWKCGIIPTGAIGEGRVSTKVKSPTRWNEPMVIDAIINALPKPFNIEQALFFCIGQILQQTKQPTKNKMDKIIRRIEEIRQKTNFWAKAMSKIGKTPDQERLERLLFMYTEESKHLEMANNHAQYLIKLSLNKVTKV